MYIYMYIYIYKHTYTYTLAYITRAAVVIFSNSFTIMFGGRQPFAEQSTSASVMAIDSGRITMTKNDTNIFTLVYTPKTACVAEFAYIQVYIHIHIHTYTYI